MAKRTIWAIALFAFMLVVLAVRGVFLDILFAVVAIIAQIEIYRTMRKASFRPALWTALVFAVLILPVFMWKGLAGVVALFTLLSLINLFWSIFLPHRNYIDTILSIFIMFYPVWPLMFILEINRIQPPALSLLALILAIGCPVITDIAAFCVGVPFGKHKLIPRVSPKKTIEGAVGGAVICTLVTIIFGWFYFRGNPVEVPFFHLPILGFVISVFSQGGDLAASAIKRFAGVKDFGNIIPGHGGVLDRLDSIVVSIVVVYCYFTLFIL